jgi:cytochrome c-type biogenesis protein CcmE
MDLTPREQLGTSTEARRRRKWLPMVFIGLVVVAGGVIVTQFLTSAIDYYCNVDEVGTRDGCEGDRRIRVQGIVLENSVKKIDGATTFTLVFNEKEIDIAYEGDPGGIFQECIPVVAHGRLVEGAFESDRIEVKHSNQYVEVNEERLAKANEEAAACSVLEG